MFGVLLLTKDNINSQRKMAGIMGWGCKIHTPHEKFEEKEAEGVFREKIVQRIWFISTHKVGQFRHIKVVHKSSMRCI